MANRSLMLGGIRFGRLLVIKKMGRDRRGNALWRCACDCGGEAITRSFMLKSGRAKSCGCYHRDDLVIRQTKDRISVSEKSCSTCGQIKSAELFPRNISRTDGLASQCKYCKNVEYKRRNRGPVNESHALRRAHIRRATPSWVDRREIRSFYAEASRKTAETGIPHHVDHIEPIQGTDISGLHVPWNLQVVTASYNCAKGNRRLRAFEKVNGIKAGH